MRRRAILRSATLMNAEIICQKRKLGELVNGAHVLVVEGPDLSVFRNDGGGLASILCCGNFMRKTL